MVLVVINFCSLIVSNLEDGCSIILENSWASYKFVWHSRKISRKFNTYAIGFNDIIPLYNLVLTLLLKSSCSLKCLLRGNGCTHPEMLTSSYVMKLKLRSFTDLLVLSLIFNIQTRRLLISPVRFSTSYYV